MNAGRVDESEVLFGRLLVEQGLARAEHVEECLAELTRLAEEGMLSLPRLGPLLARKGYLTANQYQPTIRVSDGGGAPSNGSARPALDDSLPGHIREAARSPENC